MLDRIQSEAYCTGGLGRFNEANGARAKREIIPQGPRDPSSRDPLGQQDVDDQSNSTISRQDDESGRD